MDNTSFPISGRFSLLVAHCLLFGFVACWFLRSNSALVLLTEWKEFRSPDFEEIKAQLKTPVIFDGRNQFNAFDLDVKGFEYIQIGK